MDKLENQDKILLDWLDTYIPELLEECHVPGAAVAIMKDGEILLKKGFGFRDLEKKLPVTEDTLFPIGSNTKSFTTMALGILCDDGKFDWDTPIKSYLSDFQLSDSYATEHATAIDLATHRTGLPRHDFLWYNSKDSREELFKKLRYMSFSKEFRTSFQYQNLTYMALGYLVGKVSGEGFENFVQSRIFEPLEMKRANFSIDALMNDENAAKPYRDLAGKPMEIPYARIDAIGPAGSINASVEALIPWVKLHLNSGSIDEKQIISAVGLNRMHKPHIVIAGQSESELLCSNYGLGWQVDAYRGYTMVNHGGNINGFSSKINLVPSEKIGVVILCNQDSSLFPIIVGRAIIDRLLNLEDANWKHRFFEKYSQMMKTIEAQSSRIDNEKIKGTSPSHPLEAYTGTYDHPAYGKVSVTLQDNKLWIKTNFMDKSVALEHYHYDTFMLKMDLGIRDLVLRIPFYSDIQGNIVKISLRLEPTIERIEFNRIADTQENIIADLHSLVGEYESSLGISIKIELNKDNNLILNIPKQPAFELVNQGNNIFILKGLKGFSVKFNIEENALCNELILTQPNGVFKLNRKQ